MKGDLQKYTIYTLTDPITGEVKYVGITTKPLVDRLCGHIADKLNKEKHLWISELRKQGKFPFIDELEVFYDKPKRSYNNEIENYWISQFNTWGFELFNKRRKRRF